MAKISSPLQRLRLRVARSSAAIGLAGLVAVLCAPLLGGLSADAAGGSDGSVMPCDTDGVEVAFSTSFDPLEARHEVEQVIVSGIATACMGSTLEVTVADGAGSTLADGSLVVAGPMESVAFASGTDASIVALVSVGLSG